MTVPLLFVVSALTFILVSLTPGNAAEEILGTSATPPEYAALNRALGLDLPIYEQYWNWLRHALTGNLGESIFTNQPVTQEIGQRLPVTLSLLVGRWSRGHRYRPRRVLGGQGARSGGPPTPSP